MYAQKGYSCAIAFKRATVSSLGGVGSVFSNRSFSAVLALSKVWVEVLPVAETKLKVFFFMHKIFSSEKCN
jgi:hypothetical protein